ncbi:MAG: pseudouridine synthase [Clostridia bacterium]|nr:pseudouridine synthase [Clostridia bacterium]
MRYYMLNKPSGTLTACSDPRHKTVMDLFPEEERCGLFPVGRLDKDTEGLLLITDDGALCASLLNPECHVEKTYLFYAVGALDEGMRARIEEGIKLYPTREVYSRPATLTVEGSTTLSAIREKLSPDDLRRANRRPDTPVFCGRVSVTEGKKHQVKRMLLYGGCRIVYLKRVSMGALTLDPTLPVGEYRPLTEAELHTLA